MTIPEVALASDALVTSVVEPLMRTLEEQNDDSQQTKQFCGICDI